MKVVYICPTHFSPDSVIAGAERYAYGLAKAMARMTTTTLVTFGPESFTREEEGLTTKCFRRLFYVKGNRTNPFSLGNLGVLLRADVIHCHQFKTVATDLAILLGWVLGKKVFVTDLSGNADFSLSYHLPLWKGVRAFLLISEYNRRLQPDLPVKIQIIYGGVDQNLFCPNSEAKKGNYLYVGRIFPLKGIHDLLEALPNETSLDVVGQSRDDEYLSRLKEMSVRKKVTFCPDLSDVELVRKYRESLATVLPSLVDGGFTTAMESLACGTPVIGTKVGSLPEIVEDGITGFLVPPNNPTAIREKIEYLYANPHVANEMGKRGREMVLKRFTWDRVAERCLAAYRG